MLLKKIINLICCSGFLALNSYAVENGKITLPPLPYEKDALEPYISAKTLQFHYGKHHQGYVNKLNELIAEKNLYGKTLEELILAAHKNSDMQAVYNNAAQTWNHTFYWNSMKKGGGGKPKGDLLIKIEKSFGTYKEFRTKFIEEGTKVFGSGWIWLIEAGNSLEIMATKDGDLPLTDGKKALLTCDVWEHAYYLDHQNLRKTYVEAFLDHLVNWDFAAENMKK